MKFRIPYKVIDYEVWGNERDGFDVNDLIPTPFEISVTENMRDETIIKKLVDVGFLNIKALEPRELKEFVVEGEHGYSLYIYQEYNRYPVCELRPKEDEYVG